MKTFNLMELNVKSYKQSNNDSCLPTVLNYIHIIKTYKYKLCLDWKFMRLLLQTPAHDFMEAKWISSATYTQKDGRHSHFYSY